MSLLIYAMYLLSARYEYDWLLFASCTCWLVYKMLESIDPRWCALCSNAMLNGCTCLGGAYIHFMNCAQFQFLCKSYVVIKKPKRGRLKEHISLSGFGVDDNGYIYLIICIKIVGF